nr:reverse transcriptase domain-containing protein [Tanacetum cinerariifolium]
MRTRSSSNLPVVSPPNPSTSNPKRRNRRRSKQPFILEESPVDTMVDQRTMAELLRAPTEGYAEAILVPLILPEQFELKHSLINMMTSDQFFGLEKDNPHDHIRWGSPPVARKRTPIAKLTHAVNQQTSDVTTAMTPILKQFQATPPPASVKAVEEICVTCGGAHPYYQCLASGGNTFPELKDNIQGYVAATAVNYNQGNSVYRPPGSGSLPSNTVANPKGELKAIITRSAVILKKLPEKLRDPGKFLISCGFNELKCKALADLGASINLMPLSVWKKLGLPELISTRMTLELANRAICTPAGIARDVFVPVGKFTFLADFLIVDYESDPRVFLILGRPFLQTARALIDVHGEEMILRDGDERLTLNMRHDTSSYSNQPQKESINPINVFNDSNEDFLKDLFSTNQPSGNPTFSSHPELNSPKVNDDIFDPEGGNVLPEKLLDLDSTKYLDPPLHVNPLSGSTTYSSLNQLLEEFPDELALITFPLEYDDDLQFDIDNLANLNDNLVDSMPEMFTDEHPLDYSSHPLFDEYDDDLFSDTDNVYDDPFNSKGEKIKESKLLIDELDLPCDFLLHSEYDSILSEDFSRVDAWPSTNNEDKVFNLGILIQENPFEIITHVAKDKKLAISHASLIIEDFDPPLCELPFFKEVSRSKMLLSFSSKNEKKVFKPGIHTSGKVHSSLITELSHQGYKVFKINRVLKSMMKIFLFSCGKDTHILVIPCLHFYPLDQFKYSWNLKTHAKGFCPPVFISSASFGNHDFSRDDVLFSPDNEDKVFNPGILSHEKSVKIITHVTQEKKLAVSFVSWLSEDFDPPFSELLVFKEVPISMRLLPFSSENEEKVFKPGIYTFKKFQ